MSTKRLLERDQWKELVWGYAAQGMNVGAGLLLLPILLRHFSREEIAVWLILMTVQSLIFVLDFGISLSVSRNISYVVSGAQELSETGIARDSNAFSGRSELNHDLLLRLLVSAKKLYFTISIFLFFFLASFGTLYFYSVASPIGASNPIHLLWILHLLFCSLNFYFGYINAALYGFGKIIESSKIIFFSRLLFLLLAILFLYRGGKILSLVLASGAMVLSLRFGAAWVYGRVCREVLGEFQDKWWLPITKATQNELSSTLWYNAARTALIALAGFLVVRANTFVCSTQLGLNVTASYALSLQLFSVLVAFSQVSFNNSLPAISTARIHSDKQKLRTLIHFALKISLLSYVTGALLIIFAGSRLLNLIHSNTQLLEQPKLIVLAVILLLELNHNNFANIISTRNEIPYLSSYLLSGISILFGAFFLLHFTHIGVWSILIAQGSIQLLYNNWKWPLEVWRELENI